MAPSSVFHQYKIVFSSLYTDHKPLVCDNITNSKFAGRWTLSATLIIYCVRVCCNISELSDILHVFRNFYACNSPSTIPGLCTLCSLLANRKYTWRRQVARIVSIPDVPPPRSLWLTQPVHKPELDYAVRWFFGPICLGGIMCSVARQII
jgi:hypothetical protein